MTADFDDADAKPIAALVNKHIYLKSYFIITRHVAYACSQKQDNER
jgi:hypothetical protein